MAIQPGRGFRRVFLGCVAASTMLLAVALPVAAHSHTAENGQSGEGQLLANGQNHPRFASNGDGTFSSCESYGAVPGSSIGAAWYGLETAHHGPDSGDRGRGDGCYVADGNPGLGEDDQNPAIR